MALLTSILTGGVNLHPTTSEEANFIGTDFFTAGVVGTITNTSSVAPMTGAFALNAQGTPDMTIACTAGAAYVTATPSGQNSQRLRVRLTANQNVTISANSSGSTKYDWVYLKIDPTLANAPTLAGDTVATLVTSRSTSLSTDDGTPPTYGLVLAVVTVANGASSITNSVIRDARVGSSLNIVSATDGWQTSVLPAVSSVTNNGNGSYDINFASTVASTLSSGMKGRTTRTVAAPTYMGGAFNGSSHYFIKTTPTSTLSTITNNFSLRATFQPTSYAANQVIMARCDAAGNNYFFLRMESSGVLSVAVANGAGNFRQIQTTQSLVLNKKTRIWATWASGTVLVYLNGTSVPVATATTGGTAPTTAGTGGDFAVGRLGSSASQYATGYISDVGVFDAVISATTIKALDGQALTGSETNCIGAWSLNNTAVNQKAPGTNDLTATGGVGYTNKSPYGNDGVSSMLDYFLVMSVSGSTTTVQVPEGCTIPTSGGVTSVAYSTDANPYGWVSDKGRWYIITFHSNTLVQTAPTNGVYYNISNNQLSVPVGSWIIGVTGQLGVAESGGTLIGGNVTLSKATNAADDFLLTTTAALNAGAGAAANINLGAPFSFDSDIKTTAITPYYLNVSSSSLTAPVVDMSIVTPRIKAIPSCL